jgi:hypothetical protein
MLHRASLFRYRIVGILLTLILAFSAQFLFTGEVFTHFQDSNTWNWTSNFFFATILLIAAAGCAIWTFLPRTEGDDKKVSATLQNIDRRSRVWLIAAVCAYLLAQVIYLVRSENALVDVLWLAGIAFLIIPVWIKNKSVLDQQNIPAWEWGLVAAITVIGSLLRYWHLTEIPSHVSNDVALMGDVTSKLINSGNFNWIGSSSETGHLLSYDQLLAWSMRLFGQNQYGIVMFSVIFGTLSLPMVFLLGREMGGRPVGLISISLLTINYTHIQFSRILFGTSATLFAILTFYLLTRGLRTRQPLWFGLAGVTISLGLLFYDAGRILPVIVMAMIAWQWLWQKESLRANLKNWLFLITGALVSFGPILAFALSNLFDFTGRGNVVMLWTPDVWNHEMATYQTTSGLRVIMEQVWRTFLTPFLTGDNSPLFLFQRPIVASLVAVLSILGVGFIFSRLKNDKYFMLASWVILTFIFGGVLTSDPPFWPHLIVAIPAILMIAALGAVRSIELTAPLIGRYGYLLLGSVMVVAILITGFVNWTAYYSFVQNNALPKMRISRYLSSLSLSYHAYLLSTDFSWKEHTFAFFNRDMPGQDLTPEMLQSDPPASNQPGVFILFNHPELVLVLQNLYPGGELIEHTDFNNNLAFISYKVTPPGAVLPSPDHDIHVINLPGWWIITAALLAGLVRAGYLFLKRRQNAHLHPVNAT